MLGAARLMLLLAENTDFSRTDALLREFLPAPTPAVGVDTEARLLTLRERPAAGVRVHVRVHLLGQYGDYHVGCYLSSQKRERGVGGGIALVSM